MDEVYIDAGYKWLFAPEKEGFESRTWRMKIAASRHLSSFTTHLHHVRRGRQEGEGIHRKSKGTRWRV